MRAVVPEAANRVPPLFYLATDESPRDQPVQPGLQGRPPAVRPTGTAELLVPLKDRGVGYSMQLLVAERVERVIEHALEQRAAGNGPHCSDILRYPVAQLD
jgi:hypothetical protein